MKSISLFFSCVAIFAQVAFGDVTFSSLLDEMADAEALSRVPSPFYRIRQWSSSDRMSVRPGEDAWFANSDWENYLSTNGQERVMVDAKGPGALVRIWCAGRGWLDGRIRIYLDGSLFAEGVAAELVGGTALCDPPFSFQCAPDIEAVHHRGYNLMLPIPFAHSCRVTYEPADPATSKFFYNAETRHYPAETKVVTLTRDALAKSRDKLKDVASRLNDFPKCSGQSIDLGGVIAPGESRTFSQTKIAHPAAIRVLRLRFADAQDALPKSNALEQVSIEFTFDGRQTINLPVYALAATCPEKVVSCKTRYSAVSDAGLLQFSLPMPYRDSVMVRIVNHARQPVDLAEAALEISPYDWRAGESQYLAATYVRRRGIPTAKDGKPYTLYFARRQGVGTLVGAGIFVFNKIAKGTNPWWGEGDEKISVDGEAFPSIFGTGSEDFFNYAWGDPKPFAWPFVAQPIGEGNSGVGHTVNLRWLALERVPFMFSLDFEMELWHWAKDATMDYDSIVWCYVK